MIFARPPTMMLTFSGAWAPAEPTPPPARTSTPKNTTPDNASLFMYHRPPYGARFDYRWGVRSNAMRVSSRHRVAGDRAEHRPRRRHGNLRPLDRMPEDRVERGLVG